MLKLLIPLSLMVVMPYSKFNWLLSILVTMLMAFMTLQFLASSTFAFKYTQWAMMDQFSTPLFTLTLWITAMMMLASYKILLSQNKPKLFLITIMILNITLMAAFSASNLLVFYIWFEASLIPTLILILKWGYQPERLQASMYLMMYTIMASLPMLTCLLVITSHSACYDMALWFMFSMPLNKTSFMWLICILGFLVKLPLYSTHLWLPKAHVEAPVAGSMILAAILLKLGGYGTIRLSSLFPWMNKIIAPLIMSISLVGGIITSLICIRQSDLKSLIAYSSVSHMGLMIAGVMTSSKWGVSGGLAMMVAHGFSSSALFAMANINYNLLSTRSLFLSKSFLTIMPIITFWWFLFTIMNMAAPPSMNLLSEITLITSISAFSSITMVSLGLISFITAGYSLYLYASVSHGNPNQYLASTQNMSTIDSFLLLMHLVPALIIITKPQMVML